MKIPSSTTRNSDSFNNPFLTSSEKKNKPSSVFKNKTMTNNENKIHSPRPCIDNKNRNQKICKAIETPSNIKVDIFGHKSPIKDNDFVNYNNKTKSKDFNNEVIDFYSTCETLKCSVKQQGLDNCIPLVKKDNTSPVLNMNQFSDGKLKTDRNLPSDKNYKDIIFFDNTNKKSKIRREKSPLQANIMLCTMNRSKSFKFKHKSTVNNEKHLQEVLEAKEKEIEELKFKLNDYCKNIEDSALQNTNSKSGLNFKQGCNKVKIKIETLKFANRDLQEKINDNEAMFKNIIFDTKMSYENKARINIETLKYQIALEHANNNNQAIYQLKQKILKLQNDEKNK